MRSLNLKSLRIKSVLLSSLISFCLIGMLFWAIQPSPAIPSKLSSTQRPTFFTNDSIGIALEGFAYPYPVQFLNLTIEGQPVRMGYMDIRQSDRANGRTVLLLHGRNFSGSYWQPTIQSLVTAGYRVVVPDQVGFGKSSKPDVDYSFDMLAMNTMQLLDSLNIETVDVVGHSMGGMLAVRLARLYPKRIQRVVLEAPVGLEDYRLKVPPQTIEQLQQDESLSEPAAIERFLRNFVHTWMPERDQRFVQTRVRLAQSAEYSRWTRAMARTWHMIYREPIRYELSTLTQPTLLMIGLEDRIALGRAYVSQAVAATMGNFPELSRFANQAISRSKLVEISGAGHIPHHEMPERFNQELLKFLSQS
ncbi:alpha/beta hydrolase [Nostocales cyanobacterium LEGE 11386]|nr:alpha/beta hydrolase [Nostocales cyanobacterium LEGE 11386]